MYTTKSIAGLTLLVVLGVGFVSYNTISKNKTKNITASTEALIATSTTLVETAVTPAATSSEVIQTKPAGNQKENLALRSNAEWKKVLSANEYAVLREGATERPYTSPLLNEKRKGSYVTADCGELVFRSEQKFDSGTGWPSFYAQASANAVVEKKDTELGIERTEIVSAKCGSHLGHVFNDAPQTPTGLRYCINGIALRFIPD